MTTLNKEVRAIQNPALGSVLIWRAASSYQMNHQTGSSMPLPLCFLVLPIAFHEETSALVSGTRTASGLRKLTEKFRSAEESKTDLLLAVGGRAVAMRALTWESIKLGLTSNVISLDTERASLGHSPNGYAITRTCSRPAVRAEGQGRLTTQLPSYCRFAHLSELAIDSSLANSQQPGRFQRLAIRPLVGGHDDRPLHFSHRRKRFRLRDLAEEDGSFLSRTRLLEPFCRCGNQSVSLFELLKALRILPNHDSLHHALNNPHDRLRQSRATTPTTGAIAPSDEFATAATDFIPFLAHDVTSQVESALAQSKRLSCALVSLAVGQSAAFLRFLEI